MLLKKPLTKGAVITVKLTSGEEVLCRYDSETDNELLVDKPATIAQGPKGMGIIPWMMTSQSASVKLNKNTVVAFVSTDEEIAKAYTENTTDLKLV
jgi:hypothetical protein